VSISVVLPVTKKLYTLYFVAGVSELELTLEPQDSVVVPGSAAIFNCAARSSIPGVTPTIQWREDGQFLSSIGDQYR
jgi:hypothetical protein